MLLAPQRRSPILPGNSKDRTGANGILRRARAELRRRFASLERDVLDAFGRIRILGGNDDAGTPLRRTAYMLTPEQISELSAELQRAVDRWLTEGAPASAHWWASFDAEASHLGTAQSVENLSALSPAYASSRSLQAVLFSEPYRNRLAAAQVRSMDHWTGLGATLRAELSQIIGRGVVDGKNPRVVRREIAEQMGVSRARAELYAQTDITGTLREARWAEADHASEELGLSLALLWTSAFLPTTRQTHAARHGQAYTSKEVREFYSRSGNRYRCFLPGTIVSGRFSAGIKSHYKGPAVRLVTARGHELAITANHPVLTARGMVPAAEVREGDDLIAHEPKHELLPARVGELQSELTGARVEDVFGALVQAGHQFAVRVRPIDLHGDARFCEPEVDVVWADRELVFGMDAAAGELLDDLALVNANPAAPGSRAFDLLRQSDLAHARHEVGGSDMRSTLIWPELRHPVALTVAPIALRQTQVLEGARDGVAVDTGSRADRKQQLAEHVVSVQAATKLGGPVPREYVHTEPDTVERFAHRPVGDADALGNVLHSLAGLASLDKVTSATVIQYEGHVFDLQERSGLMLANCIVASNCHCAQTEALLDEFGKPILSASAKRGMAKERAVWQRQHPA